MILTFNYPSGEGRQYTQFRYPAGEVQVRLTELSLKYLAKLDSQTDKVRVIARITDGEIVPLAQLLDAIKSVTDGDVQLILPYLPYARADRRFVPGDTDGLAVFGRLLAMFSYDVVTLDAHSEKAQWNVRHLTNVSALPIIASVIDKLDGTSTYGTSIISTAVLLPDEGANRYELPVGPFVLHAKKKRDPATGKLSGFEVPSPQNFKADNILIVDDICDGGATFIGIADALRESGNTLPLYLYVTHGIFSKGLEELLKRFDHIYTTDSFNDVPWNTNRLTRVPCLGTILDTLEKRGDGTRSV